jgi:hypothetical protein
MAEAASMDDVVWGSGSGHSQHFPKRMDVVEAL